MADLPHSQVQKSHKNTPYSLLYIYTHTNYEYYITLDYLCQPLKSSGDGRIRSPSTLVTHSSKVQVIS